MCWWTCKKLKLNFRSICEKQQQCCLECDNICICCKICSLTWLRVDEQADSYFMVMQKASIPPSVPAGLENIKPMNFNSFHISDQPVLDSGSSTLFLHGHFHPGLIGIPSFVPVTAGLFSLFTGHWPKSPHQDRWQRWSQRWNHLWSRLYLIGRATPLKQETTRPDCSRENYDWYT